MARLHGAILGAAVLAGMMGGATASRAADDGYENVFSSVLTAVGVLKDDPSPEIEYRERAPLVLPPKNELTQPMAPGKARTAAWPQDPDVLKRRKAAEEARAPMPNLLGNQNDLISKDELMKGRTTASAEADNSRKCGQAGNARGCLVLSPDQLRAEQQNYEANGGSRETSKVLAAGEEPNREYLTQPPKGYMKLSKSVKVTTEAPKTYVDESNPNSNLVYRKKDDE